MATFSTSFSLAVHNDQTGEKVRISEDRDALGLVELGYVTDDGHETRFTMPREQARMVAAAMVKLCDLMDGEEAAQKALNDNGLHTDHLITAGPYSKGMYGLFLRISAGDPQNIPNGNEHLPKSKCTSAPTKVPEGYVARGCGCA